MNNEIAEKIEKILLYTESEEEDNEDYWNWQDNFYGLACSIIRKESYTLDVGEIDTTEYFEKIDETISGEYGYLITRFVFQSKNSKKFFAVDASTDSWEDDGTLGDDFNVVEVFPKQVTITKYVTADELQD